MENLEPIKEEALAILPEGLMEVKSKEDYTKAGDVLKLVKNKIKYLDEKRKEYTAPLEKTKKKLIEDFKLIIEPLQVYVNDLSKVMIEFNTVEQKRLDAEQAKIDAKALKDIEDKKESSIEVKVVNDIKTQRGAIAVTTVKKTWDFEIVDEEKVPREFCSPDSVKIRQAIKRGQREIDGVKIFIQESINSR